MHLVVARKISGPGEPLTTVATTGTESLMLPRKDRHLVLAHRRGEWPPPTPQKQKDDKNKFKKSKKKERPPVPVGCTCERCTAHGDLAAMSASDERLEEIRKLENDLRSDNPQLASAASAARLVELYRLEGLETRIARAYELAALTLNYIGEDAAKVRKQAELARLGYIVEEGPDSNAAVAMRVMASDVRGHYSYKYLDVLREKAAQAAAARGR